MAVLCTSSFRLRAACSIPSVETNEVGLFLTRKEGRAFWMLVLKDSLLTPRNQEVPSLWVSLCGGPKSWMENTSPLWSDPKRSMSRVSHEVKFWASQLDAKAASRKEDDLEFWNVGIAEGPLRAFILLRKR